MLIQTFRMGVRSVLNGHLLRDAHQASDKGENLFCGLEKPSQPKDQQQRRLTSRGRTSTISSGTKKIKAFIFLAIEMANLAAAGNLT